MASRSRTLACSTACAFAIVAPAHAANGDAPGALKKQTTTPEHAAPGPAEQAPVATTPTPAPAPNAGPKAETKSAPINKRTVRKLVQSQTTTTPAGSTTTRTHAVRRSTTRRAAVRRGTQQRRAAARSRNTVPVRAHGRAGAPGQQIAAGAPATAPGQAIAAGKRPAAATAAAADAAAKRAKARENAGKKDDDPAPLTSLSRTADHVVEVIPGAVILALAGLIALVLVLILRSLAVERQRGRAIALSYGVTVEALATAIEAKDHTTGGHIERVRKLGLLLAGEIIPRDARDPQMAYGFLLHDIGKLAVPDAILRAPGRLTEEEWALMRRHPDEGVRMLSNVPFLGKALDVVRHHHERWDGGGYPEGLRGEGIPVWARIFAVADALDAMTAERPYRAPRSYADAVEEITRNAGTQFDPAVVEALENLDPAVVLPLLEPAQQAEPLAELPAIESPVIAA